MSTKLDYVYPTIQRKVIGATIDVFLLMYILNPIERFLRYVFLYISTNNPSIKNVYSYLYLNSTLSTNDVFRPLLDGLMIDFIIRIALLHLIIIIVLFLILSFFWCKKGATFGKMLTNCIIIDDKTHSAITFRKAIVRYAALIITLLPLGLGFITVVFSKKGKSLHDIIAGTTVVMQK